MSGEELRAEELLRQPSGPWPCCTDATGMPVSCQHRALRAAPSTEPALDERLREPCDECHCPIGYHVTDPHPSAVADGPCYCQRDVRWFAPRLAEPRS